MYYSTKNKLKPNSTQKCAMNPTCTMCYRHVDLEEVVLCVIQDYSAE